MLSKRSEEQKTKANKTSILKPDPLRVQNAMIIQPSTQKPEKSPRPLALNLEFLSSSEQGESHTILDGGEEVGKVSYVIFADYNEVCKNFDFRAPFPHSLADYLKAVNLPEVYPMAYLPYASVDNDKRDSGLGTRLLSELEDILYEKGCKLMFGKMGWEIDDWEKEMHKNKHFYHTRGWRSYFFGEDDPILIFKTVEEPKGEPAP